MVEISVVIPVYGCRASLKPIFYSLKNGGVDGQRIAKARQGLSLIHI